MLRGHPGLADRIVNSALGQFPVIGGDVQTRTLHGSLLALVVGIVVAVWSGMGVFLAVENAMNHLWGVPFRRRPNAVRRRVRAFLLLLVLGAAVIVSTGLGAFSTVGARYGVAWKIGSALLAMLLNVGVFWFAFRELTAEEVGWSDVRNGAIVAAAAYEGLQLLGGYYVGHVLSSAKNTYGTFALVIGLLSWLYLASLVTLLAAEANVVARRRLWPRSFSVVVEEPATRADEAALTQRARVEERRSDERVSVEFREDE